MESDKQAWRALVKDHLAQASRPLIVVLGPTASGKTGFSVNLAHWITEQCGRSAEIINADSRQLFRGMNIGTAKVTEAEMQGVPHHLLNVLDPTQEANVSVYKQQAEQLIDELLNADKVPLLVGGSMLYIASVTDDLSFDNSIRTELRSPTADCKYDVLILGLGKDREEVVEKINNRTAAMFQAGWVQEVRQLLADGYSASDPGFKACGYKEIAEYLEKDGDETELMEHIAAKTRQYARRQMTWWRGDTRIHWL